jgi:multicomponent Na+:H+ antiporter subunit D
VNWEFWLPLLLPASSLFTGVLIFLVREEQFRLRTTLNLLGASVKIVLVAVIVWESAQGRIFEARLDFLPGLDLVLRVDFLALLFASLSAVLWLLTTVYAIGYLEDSPNRSRFFGFFSLCVTATMGIAHGRQPRHLRDLLRAAHRGDLPAGRAPRHRRGAQGGADLPLYTVFGGVLLLLGAVWLHALAGPLEFVAGGSLGELVETRRTELILVFGLLVTGLGVKAAIVPLHGWLPWRWSRRPR